MPSSSTRTTTTETSVLTLFLTTFTRTWAASLGLNSTLTQQILHHFSLVLDIEPVNLFKLASKDDRAGEMLRENEGMRWSDRMFYASNAVADAAGLLGRIGREGEKVWLEEWARELWGLGGEWWKYEQGGRVGG